jgi:protoporphyrinogen oxidase
VRKNIVIVGGGIAGLLSALMLSKNKKYQIHIVERGSEIGGLQKSFDYKEYGTFDYGAHNILESGIQELDELIVGLLPENEWQVSSAVNGQRRALTGLFYNGKLQLNSPFIDLRGIDSNALKAYIGDFFFNLGKRNLQSDHETAYDVAKHLFGEKITSEILTPVFKKLFNKDANELDAMAMHLTPFSRICLFEQNIMNELVKTETIGTSLSFTDQKKLPSQYLPPLKTYYPKKYGMHRVIDAIEERLKNENVIIHINSNVTKITHDEQMIQEIYINNTLIPEVEQFIFSAGLVTLSKLLNINTQDLQFDQNPETIIINILIDKPLNIGDLSYFYCYDEGYKTFRVDNYINYCDGAVRDGLYPISIEMLSLSEKGVNLTEMEHIAIKELNQLNILQKNTKIIFTKGEALEYGFPLLSQKNIQNMNKIRENINTLKLKNLVKIGILSEQNLFFETDIKKDVFFKIKKILDKGAAL